MTPPALPPASSSPRMLKGVLGGVRKEITAAVGPALAEHGRLFTLVAILCVALPKGPGAYHAFDGSAGNPRQTGSVVGVEANVFQNTGAAQMDEQARGVYEGTLTKQCGWRALT